MPFKYSWVALVLGFTCLGYQTSALPDVPPAAWVSLWDWASERNYKMALKDAQIVLRNDKVALSFTTASPLAEINGIKVWLCDPIAFHDGQAFISKLDVQATIDPILFPAKQSPGNGIKTICLDPGHGGKDNGGQAGTFLEKKYTLLLAKELKKQLNAAGFKVVMTREDDKFVELDDRPAFANQNQADLFISLHFNVDPQGGAKGVEVYCLTPAKAASTNSQGKSANTEELSGNQMNEENTLLAYQLQKSLVHNLSAEDRGLHRARFAVLRTARMPAVLIEGGFLSNGNERKKIADSASRKQMAKAIVQGIMDFTKSGLNEDHRHTENRN